MTQNMPPIQFDYKVRLVSEENLRAMCERISLTSHRFWVERVGDTRVLVGYSNPDEYGVDHPVFVKLPVYLQQYAGNKRYTPCIVLENVGVVGTNERKNITEDYISQMFLPLFDAPELWRNPNDGKWYTREEWSVSF